MEQEEDPEEAEVDEDDDEVIVVPFVFLLFGKAYLFRKCCSVYYLYSSMKPDIFWFHAYYMRSKVHLLGSSCLSVSFGLDGYSTTYMTKSTCWKTGQFLSLALLLAFGMDFAPNLFSFLVIIRTFLRFYDGPFVES